MPRPQGEEALNQLLEAFTRTAGTDSDTKPTWNTTGALRRAYYERMGAYLLAQEDYDSLITGGWVRVGNKIAVSSNEHATALDSDTVPKGDLEHPSPLRFVAPSTGVYAPCNGLRTSRLL